MNKDARFYFANLGADIARCITAAHSGNAQRYTDSFNRAMKTLSYLRASHRPEAYEEGLLLVRGLEYARSLKTLDVFGAQVNQLMAEYSPIL